IKHPIYSFDALVVGKDTEDDDSRETFINGDPFNGEEAREYPFLLEEVPEEEEGPPEEPAASIVQQQPTCPEMETCDLGEVREYTLPNLPNSSPLNYLIFREGRQTRYKCLDCGFLTLAYCRLKTHFELHGPDSGAVACAFCGVLVGSGSRRMELHKTTYHAAPLLQLRPSKKIDVLSYYECADCGALYQSTGRLKKHKKQVHSQESHAETCRECGWVVANIGKHVGYWHPPEGSKVAELRKQRHAGGLRIVKM
ncbi:Zinc finger and BTB domain-containing protein 17, partial [Orchesella cincta]